jgi:hypothetical protein
MSWILEHCDKERVMLRRELAELKKCQLLYLTFSVTSTGLILGFSRMSAPSGGKANFAIDSGLIFLAPLLIVIPFWWCFFDKATSITRIVAYQRILEGCITRRIYSLNFVGWESSLGLHRKGSAAMNPKPPVVGGGMWKMFLLREHHRYWMVTFYTFLALSTACLLCAFVSWFASDKSAGYTTAILLVIALSTAIWIVSTYANARRVKALLHGDLSYDAQEENWVDLLRVVKRDSPPTPGGALEQPSCIQPPSSARS